jgi:hypothetical protein
MPRSTGLLGVGGLSLRVKACAGVLAERILHDLMPHRADDKSRDFLYHRAVVVVPGPYADDKIWRVTDGPRVFVGVGGTGLYRYVAASEGEQIIFAERRARNGVGEDVIDLLGYAFGDYLYAAWL